MAALSQLGAAWLRRDIDALDRLFDICSLSSVVIPECGLAPGDIHVGAQSALASMRGQLADGDAGVADGVLAAGFYFQALLAWEGTDDFDEITRFVDDAVGFLTPLVHESAFRSVGTAVQMLNSIQYQCRTEEARLCACSYSMELTAKEAAAYLEQVTVPDRGVHRVDDLLLDLVRRDVDNALAYHAVLANHIAPLAARFADALIDTSPASDGNGLSKLRADVRTDIRATLPHLAAVADEMTAAGDVLGTELSVQVDALARMADAVAAPSLVLDRGQLIYVYPFTLPPSGDRAIRDLGQHSVRVEGHDVGFRFQDVRRTDAWRRLAEGASETFTAFSDRGELVLDDGYELRFRPKWIEMEERRGLPLDSQYHAFGLRVVLGSHGGHYVHLETQIGQRVGEDGPDPWSGAHIDQWVRRLSSDAGQDRVALHRDGTLVAAWANLHGFAASVAAAIAAVDAGPASVAPAVPDLAGQTVIFQVDAARVIEHDGVSRPLRASDHIDEMTGYTALMAGVRYLPASVEEWIRLDAPAPENLLEGLRPVGDTLLVNGEVMVLMPLGSPNWIVLEQVEILEFAISLHGYLQQLSDRLRRRLRSEEMSGGTPTIDEVTDDIGVGNRVLELLRSRGLMRSRYHSELLARIFRAVGARDLDARVDKTVEALRDVRRELEEEERNRQADSLSFTLYSLTIVTVFIAVYQFVDSFFTDVGAFGRVIVLAIAAAATAGVGIGYRYLRHRRQAARAARPA